MNQLSILIVTLSTLLMVACAPTGQVIADTPQPIKIGGILILSGIGSDWGTATADGAKLAVAEINAAGGINGRPLELVLQDNPGDNPVSGITAYQQLRGQGIDVMLGTTWSTSAWAVMPLACDDHTVLVSASVGTAKFAEACTETFNVYPADVRQSYALGQALAQHGHSRLAVLASQESWQGDNARAIRDGFVSAGGAIASFELVDPSLMHFQTEALKVVQSDADVAFVLPNFAAIGTAAMELRALGYEGQLVSTYLDSDIIASAKGAWDDGIIPSAFTPTDAFNAKYAAAYGTNASIGADTGYDAVQLIAQAMRSSGSSDSAAVTQALSEIESYSGVSGELTFDEFGGVTKATAYLQVRDGVLTDFAWQ